MPLIQIFNGKRGIGISEKDTAYVQIAFALKRHLQQFRGARLNVFLAIVLHSNEVGLSWPSIDTLRLLTDYSNSTVSQAVQDLAELTLNGERVLAVWRERDEKGKFVGGNHYLIFPRPDELAIIEAGGNVTDSLVAHFLKNPLLGKPTSGETQAEPESGFKPEPEEQPGEAVPEDFIEEIWMPFLELCQRAGGAKHPAGLAPPDVLALLAEEYGYGAIRDALEQTWKNIVVNATVVARPYNYLVSVLKGQQLDAARQRRKEEVARSMHDALPTFGEDDHA